MLDVKNLQYFIAAYEAKGFARASVVLHTVQSNVSAHIGRLEMLLEVKLFERHRRGIVATTHGEQLYCYAKRVLALLDETENAVKCKEAAVIDRIIADHRH